LKYFVALVAGYYVLEALRHLVRQISKWDAEETALSLGYKVVLWGVILFTCVCWPLMFLKRRTA
jgi:hypothetical protein